MDLNHPVIETHERFFAVSLIRFTLLRWRALEEYYCLKLECGEDIDAVARAVSDNICIKSWEQAAGRVALPLCHFSTWASEAWRVQIRWLLVSQQDV